MVKRTLWMVALIALLAHFNQVHAGPFHGHKRSQVRDEVILSELPASFVDETDLPKHWDWRNVDGINFVTSDVNQHIPQYCGSCWVHGTVAALNDRIKIMRNAQFPDVMLSRQAVNNCALNASKVAPGCNGGDPWMVFKTMSKRPIPDESCQPYHAANEECTDYNVCRNCNSNDTIGCFPIQSYAGFMVGEYGSVKGNRNIMKEIYTRGPVTCSYVANDLFLYNYSQVSNANDGVYVDTKNYSEAEVDHDVEITGWGETSDGVEYWIARNSWGTYWGEAGWFKVMKGTLHMENDCWWAIPEVAALDKYLDGHYIGSYNDGLLKQDNSVRRSYRPRESHRVRPSTVEYRVVH